MALAVAVAGALLAGAGTATVQTALIVAAISVLGAAALQVSANAVRPRSRGVSGRWVHGPGVAGLERWSRRLRDSLELTPEQSESWEEVAEALRAGYATAITPGPDGEAEVTAMGAPGVLAHMESRTAAILEALRRARRAFERFYGDLSEDQRKTVDRLMAHRCGRLAGWA
jgi:hypothetical protein